LKNESSGIQEKVQQNKSLQNCYGCFFSAAELQKIEDNKNIRDIAWITNVVRSKKDGSSIQI